MIGHIIAVGEHDRRHTAQLCHAPGQRCTPAGRIHQHIAAGAHHQPAARPEAPPRGPAAVVDIARRMARDEHREASHGHRPPLLKACIDRCHGTGLQGKQCLAVLVLTHRLTQHAGGAACRSKVQRIELPAGAAIDAAAVDVEGPRLVGGEALGLRCHRATTQARSFTKAEAD